MSLSSSTAALLAVIGTSAGGLGLLVALFAHLRLRKLRRSLAILQDGDDAESFLSAAAKQVELVARLRAELSSVEGRMHDLRLDVADALRHVAVVRYDAFRDMGGRMSFSAALLDDAGDGLVISAIHGRTETRSYAKGVKGGTSDQQLSPEERQAIAFATRAGAGPSGRQPTAVQKSHVVQEDLPSVLVRRNDPAEVRLFDDEVELTAVDPIES
ncbi:MAG TPA: DUF4446 family protein [Acidothermaceae bacterium]